MGSWANWTSRRDNRAAQRCSVAVILGSLVLGGVARGQSSGSSRARVMISVFDEAGVERAVVERAEARAEHDLQGSGVTVQWRNPGWDGNGVFPAGEVLRLDVHLLPHARNMGGEVFGVAFLGNDGRGQQADLFYDRIEKLGSRQARDRAALLGAVMAHELGHLLLGTHAHSAAGIMQANWDDQTLQRIAQGLIGFDPEEESRMRGRVREVRFSANLDKKTGSAASTPPPALSPEGVVLRAER